MHCKTLPNTHKANKQPTTSTSTSTHRFSRHTNAHTPHASKSKVSIAPTGVMNAHTQKTRHA